VQFGSPEKPLTVNEAGVASEADAEAGLTLAEPQDSVTVTLAALFGTKSLMTWKFAVLSVFTMVQEPAESAAAHVPLEE
jgi:hypothetical protein